MTGLNKDRIIRHLWNLFELENAEEYCHKLINVGNFITTTLLNTVMAIEIQHYQLRNTLIKLDHT